MQCLCTGPFAVQAQRTLLVHKTATPKDLLESKTHKLNNLCTTLLPACQLWRTRYACLMRNLSFLFVVCLFVCDPHMPHRTCEGSAQLPHADSRKRRRIPTVSALFGTKEPRSTTSAKQAGSYEAARRGLYSASADGIQFANYDTVDRKHKGASNLWKT